MKVKNTITLFILALLVLWAGLGLFKYSFFQTHDLKFQLVRCYDAVGTIKEGHFPLRWAGTLNFQCGVPIYNFYYPLLYYLVILVSPVAGSIMLSLKIISFAALLVGTLFFYLWIFAETKDVLASFGGAVLYLFAPYRFLLIYVRGSPEYLSYAILPVILFFYAKAFSAKGKTQFLLNAFLSALFGGLFAFSHNIVVMLLTPVILIYLVVKMYENTSFKLDRKVILIFSFLGIFGIGSFFVAPAILEQPYTQITTPIFNYWDHFPQLGQVIRSPWGWGDSAIGVVDDGMSFELGYAQWLVLVGVILWLAYKVFVAKGKLFVRFKNLVAGNIWSFGFLTLSLVFLFLVLPWSRPIWKLFPLLQTIQFPWRLLGVCVFTTSALFSFWITKVSSKRLRLLVAFIVIGLALYGNRNHLLSQPVLESDLPFYESLNNFTIERWAVPALVNTVLPPGSGGYCDVQTVAVATDNKKDEIRFNEVERGSTYGIIRLNYDEKIILGKKIILNLSYYPEIFNLSVNGQRAGYLNCGGRVCIGVGELKEGDNTISWKVGQTRIEMVSNYVSLFFLSIWLVIIGLSLSKNRA